eukprot:TRINITY_DN346_c0_g1_i2.p1 TRINITY_DN346_c0_g1~~TRINITY_DN346_c0_g1_i2.p1  ORF type:complete len:614 (-),score=139.26 TRINITY_DN346_c0_g1_i2:3288-5129(-)
MKVKLGQAVKMFFGNSSFEMLFFEALSNSFDAEATKIDINIFIEAFNKPESLKLVIQDNGVGFDDKRYKKFSNLFDVEESSHKGLGRLVYLCYFDNIEVDSTFSNTKNRTFKFSQEFKEDDFVINEVAKRDNGTTFTMRNYALQRIAKTEYLKPKEIKKRILEEFYSRLFKLKQKKSNVVINVKTTIDGKEQSESLSSNEIPKLSFVELDSTLNLIDKFQLYYSIKEVDVDKTSLISAISVDNRTHKVDLIANENIPLGYELVFLLFSDYFTGKVDASRQNLTLSNKELQDVQQIFRKKVIELIEERIPKIKKNNTKIKDGLVNRYPHLNGYFDIDNIGYIKRNEILRNAQEQFFKAQKEILEANHLTDEQFNKSLEISARALTEYILFRQLTIERLKASTNEESEADLHNLIASKGKEGRFEKSNFVNDIYKNNSWLLDDKFMTYEVTLSDREMSELVEYVVDGEEVQKDIDRPDFAFIFSNNPKENKPFDVVIVELKKRGLNHYDNLKAVHQLETRARNLMKYYDNKVQRIWYYGIIEFNEETELALSSDFTELYSSGKLYYNEKDVTVSLKPKRTVPVGIFMWDIDAIVEDANARNSAFLNFIKSKFSTE